MPARSTTSEYQPAPPFNRLNRGRVGNGTAVVSATTPANGSTKANCSGGAAAGGTNTTAARQFKVNVRVGN